MSALETLFFNQVKHSKAIAHDLQEYHRAEEGTNKKSYEFLVTAVRRYLDRERLESNRERVARNLGASSSNAQFVGSCEDRRLQQGSSHMP